MGSLPVLKPREFVALLEKFGLSTSGNVVPAQLVVKTAEPMSAFLSQRKGGRSKTTLAGLTCTGDT